MFHLHLSLEVKVSTFTKSFIFTSTSNSAYLSFSTSSFDTTLLCSFLLSLYSISVYLSRIAPKRVLLRISLIPHNFRGGYFKVFTSWPRGSMAPWPQIKLCPTLIVAMFQRGSKLS